MATDRFIVDFDRGDPDALHGWHILTRHPGHIWHAEDWHGQFWWLHPEEEVWYGLFLRAHADKLTDADKEIEAYQDWEAFRSLWPRLRGVLARLMRPSSEGEREAAAAALKRLAASNNKQINGIGSERLGEEPDGLLPTIATIHARSILELVYWYGACHFPDRPPYDPAGWQALIDSDPAPPVIPEPPWARETV